MHQCCAQIVFILIYIGVLGYCVIAMTYTASFGNIKGVLLEAALAMAVD
jgi:hypothetical protein